MKKLNQALQTILLALAFIGTTTTATAYSFKVDGIYYNVNGDNATVTYMNRNSYYNNYGNIYYKYYNDNTGYVIIPETITLDGKTYTVTAIGDYAFCHTDSEGISGISIPNTVTSIGMYAFQDCDKITEIVIPESVTTIGDCAFYDCDFIPYVNIPNSVTSIGTSAFCSCDRVRSILLGNSVTSIGESALSTGSLSYITSLSTTPPSSPGGANTAAKLYVPIESVELYHTTSGWHYFTDIRGFGDNYFSMSDFTTMHGDTIVVPVSLDNEDVITAFQTDLYLPNGFELIQDGNDYSIELSNRKGRDHVIMASEMPDGAVRVLSYSPTLKTIKGHEGELFYLTVKVPDDADGNYRIELNNTIVTTADEEEVHALNASSIVNVNNLIMGDVNNDGDITVTDVVETARYILNQNPDPFVFEAADITGDGKITITDVVKIAHLVLDADYDEPTTLRSPKRSETNERMGGEMNGNTACITLDNAQEYTAFQLDLTVTEGMTASDFALTERANGLDLIVKDKGDGKVRLMGYTASLKTIQGNEGALLTFNVTGCNDIMVDRIELVTTEGETVHPGGFTIQMSPATTVEELAASKAVDHVDYFNLAGQRIDRPESGMTLVVTTYTDGTRTTTNLIQ